MLFLLGFIALVGLTIFLGSDGGPGLSNDFPWQFRLAAKLRTPILVFVVVPLSFLLWLFRYVREHYRAIFRSEGSHSARVAKVSRLSPDEANPTLV